MELERNVTSPLSMTTYSGKLFTFLVIRDALLLRKELEDVNHLCPKNTQGETFARDRFGRLWGFGNAAGGSSLTCKPFSGTFFPCNTSNSGS